MERRTLSSARFCLVENPGAPLLADFARRGTLRIHPHLGGSPLDSLLASWTGPLTPHRTVTMLLEQRRELFARECSPMPIPCPRLVVLLFVMSARSSCLVAHRSARLRRSGTTLEAVTSSQPLRDGIEIQASAATLRITALRDDIIRVRISPNSTLPEDASWAVLPAVRTQVG